MNKKTLLILLLGLITMLLASCEYFVLPGINETVCESPNQLVQDVDGNLVCIDVGSSSEELEKEVEESIENVEIEIEPIEEVTEETGEETTEEKEVVPEEKPSETPAEVTELPRKVVTEGDLVSFPNLRATDPDGDPIAYSFTAPLDDEGKWKTQVGDAAEYKVKIIASDGENTVEQDVILVVLPKNKAPSITIEDSFTIEEGETLTLTPKVGDPEGGEVSVSYSGWMTSAERSTDFDDAGEFSVTITASDGVMKSSKTVSVTVKNVNRAPTIDRLENLEIIAGEEVKVEPSASDPDGDDLTFTFSAPLSPEGVWQTSEGETGSYKVKVLVTDGVEQDSTDLTISVRPKNLPPELSLSGSITVSEGDAIVIEATATDPEGEEVVITYSGWMRTNTYQTDFDDAGTHKVVVTASDGVNSVSEDISITVEDLNRPPSFDPGAFN